MKSVHHATICWNCKKACGRCSWSRDFTPIEGWEAIPTKRRESWNGYTRIAESYDVYNCPEFELLDTIKYNDRERDKWIRLMQKQGTTLPKDTNT